MKDKKEIDKYLEEIHLAQEKCKKLGVDIKSAVIGRFLICIINKHIVKYIY